MSTKTDLELQFDTITPSNLKDNETISKLLSLYTSSFSDQSDILENPLNLLDTNFLIEKYEETSNTKFDDVRKELFKIHLQEIYQTFAEIGDSEEIYNKFKGVYKALDVPTDQLKIVADIDKSINSEYLDAASSFKTKKGTRSGFFFVYDIINRAGIQAINADEFFNLIEGTKEDATTPYEYTVETSLYKEVFNKTVVPLAHPVGFNWNFIRLLFLTMEDYFGLEQIKTLNDTTLTCYGDNNGTIQQEEIVNSKIYGELKNFEVSVDQNKKEGIIIDYNPLDGSEGNGLRLIKEHNGRVILYDRQSEKIVKVDGEPTGEIQYLEITDVRVPLSQNGILTVNKIQRELLGETFEVVESIEFKEYTIIDKPYIDIEYKIRGDKEGNWNTSKIYYEDFSAKVVSDDVKFFNPYTITRSELLEKTGSYNGRIVEDKGNNCLLNYKATYSYKVSTKDVHEYIENIRPQQTKLEMDTSNIEIPQSEVNIAISEGRDPYEGLYSNVDHTIQEENWYDTGDNWARLDYGNYKLTGNIGDTNINPTFNKGHLASEIVIDEVTEEVSYIPDGKIIDLTIGGDWILSDNDTHEFDKGFNPNAPEGARWEQYYRPQSLSDLALVNSTNTVERYERDNTEWYDDKDKQWNTSQNNNQYHAWEDVNMDEWIQVFDDVPMYNLDTTSFYEIELGIDGNEKLEGTEVKVLDEEGNIITKMDPISGEPILYLATVYVQRAETYDDINFRPTINTPADGLQYVDGQEQESYEHNQNYVIQEGIVDADPVNLQALTYEQIYIKQYIPFKDTWSRDGNEIPLAMFNVRDEAESIVGDQPVIDYSNMDETWNIQYEVFGYNGIADKDTGITTHDGDYLEEMVLPSGNTKDRYSIDTWLVFSDEDYCYNMFTDWNIGDEEYIGYLYVEGQGHGQRVDADVYRGQWSYTEESSDFRKYEQFDIIEDKDFGNEYIAQDLTITDEDGEIKSLSDNKHVYEHKDMQDLFYQGIQEETVIDGFDINGNIFHNNEIRPAYIGYEYMYKDDFSFGMEFNLVPKPVPYCYNTFVNWNIDEELIGCAFVDGKGHYEEVQAEIYRAQWNYIEFLDNENTIRNSEFEKYEETNFALMPAVNEYWYTNENGDDTSITETNTTNDYSKLEDEDVQKDWHELEIGEEWDIGGDHNNPETNSIRQVYIGWEDMFKDDSNIFDRSLMTSQQIYTYNTFTAVYINEEENDGLIISDNDYIDGKGLNLDPEADIYRSEWNIHDDHLVTEDNVISSEYEVYGMKVYRKDGENWIYLENNNIEVA